MENMKLKNSQFYARAIAEALTDQQNDCLFVRSYVLAPQGRDCTNTICEECPSLVREWLDAEYEPPIDWLRVPIDTPVLVKEKDDAEWKKRYFCCYLPKGGRKFCVIANGLKQEEAVTTELWMECKLDPSVNAMPFLEQ